MAFRGKLPSSTLGHIPADRLHWSFPDINHLPRLFAQPDQWIETKSEIEKSEIECGREKGKLENIKYIRRLFAQPDQVFCGAVSFCVN